MSSLFLEAQKICTNIKMAIIAQIKLECIKENKYYDDETDLLSSVLHAKKNARNAPSMLSFCKLAGHTNREKKILGISTGNFSQNRKYIAVSKATNSFSAVCN